MYRGALVLVVPMLLVANVSIGQPAGIQLTISTPEDGDVVPRSLDVTGTSAGLGTNTIALFVYSPPAERWFFQGAATVAVDGRWEVRQVVVSGGVGVAPGDEDFRIVATVMRELPPGLSGVLSDDFPIPETLAQSAAVLVKREE